MAKSYKVSVSVTEDLMPSVFGLFNGDERASDLRISQVSEAMLIDAKGLKKIEWDYGSIERVDLPEAEPAVTAEPAVEVVPKPQPKPNGTNGPWSRAYAEHEPHGKTGPKTKYTKGAGVANGKFKRLSEMSAADVARYYAWTEKYWIYFEQIFLDAKSPISPSDRKLLAKGDVLGLSKKSMASLLCGFVARGHIDRLQKGEYVARRTATAAV